MTPVICYYTYTLRKNCGIKYFKIVMKGKQRKREKEKEGAVKKTFKNI